MSGAAVTYGSRLLSPRTAAVIGLAPAVTAGVAALTYQQTEASATNACSRWRHVASEAFVMRRSALHPSKEFSWFHGPKRQLDDRGRSGATTLLPITLSVRREGRKPAPGRLRLARSERPQHFRFTSASRRPFDGPQPNLLTAADQPKCWRRRAGSNRCRGLCRPLPCVLFSLFRALLRHPRGAAGRG